jgi:hypothetical protein
MARPVKVRTDYGADINRLSRLRAAVKRDFRPNAEKPSKENETWRKEVDDLIHKVMTRLLEVSK